MEYKTTRIWVKTVEALRMIYALTGESMISILDRLVAAELSRVKHDTGTQDTTEPNS